jgi:hypothetical protein
VASRRAKPTNDPFAEQLAWLMDRSIKLGPFTFGLDGILGLIPGLGDIAGGAASALIIFRAMRSGVSKGTVLRMLVNVGIDSIVGAVPVLGDLFDIAFKANTKNYQLYKTALAGAGSPRRDWGFVALVLLIVVILHAIPILVIVLLASALGFPLF